MKDNIINQDTEWELIERHETIEYRRWSKKKNFEVRYVLKSKLTGMIKVESLVMYSYNELKSEKTRL